jgi:hypothetical protein
MQSAGGEADDRFESCLDELNRGGSAEITALALSQRYSYVYPEARVLDVLSHLGPLVEIGAGTGYWAGKLRAKGVDIVAFDQAPPDMEKYNRYHGWTLTWSHVLPGDHTVLPGYPDRALFLCWPPLFSDLGNCLPFYQGETVAYIGDYGHRTARLDNLERDFTMVAEAPVRAVDPLPGAPAMLGIWKRLREGAGSRRPAGHEPE